MLVKHRKTWAGLSESRRQTVPYFWTGGWESSFTEPSVCSGNDTGSGVSKAKMVSMNARMKGCILDEAFVQAFITKKMKTIYA